MTTPSTASQTLPNHQLSLVARTLQEWKQLVLLGAPVLVAQLAQMTNGVVDTVMAGHSSAEDLAGVGIGTSLWVPTLLFFAGILGAMQPTISGHRGAQDWHKIMPTTWQGLYISMIAMVLMILFLTNMHPVLALLQLDEKTLHIADGYLKAFSWGVPALVVLMALRGLTDGLGHTHIIMIFSIVSAVLNVPLSYFFIFGFDFNFFQIPRMGGIGSGWATTMANWVAAIALLIYFNNSRFYQQYHLITHWVAPAKEEIKRLLKLGVPIGFSSFIEVSMFCMIALFIAPLGATTIAGHQIVLNLISFVFMLPLSMGIALTLRISFLVGAKDHDEARLLARSALLLALTIGSVNALLLFLGRDWLASLYTSDLAVQKIAATLFMLGAIFQLADVVQVTMMGVQRGYKDTKIPMIIMLVSFWGISLPLGYVLTFKDWFTQPMGAPGFWTALVVGLICAASLLTVRMFRFRTVHS